MSDTKVCPVSNELVSDMEADAAAMRAEYAAYRENMRRLEAELDLFEGESREEAYELNNPKHPGYAERMRAIADSIRKERS